MFYNLRNNYLLQLSLVTLLVGYPGIKIIAQQGNDYLHDQPLKVTATNRPYNDDTNKIQFAIISDVWGGRRPGIFEDAVEKLQLLQPQFVISVGDLTDGKTYDTLAMEEQWREFNADIRPLGMRFYYVPGNHDIGNPLMEKEWKKQLGRPYYYFVYKNALFMCINTEDGGHGGIRDEQVAYFQRALAENPGVRWTFLFMHRPVWQGRDNKEEGYEKIEALLKGRNYTLFSGHHHTYASMMKNGNKHFVLGTTGGGSDLRGEKFGEYDHLTMVTLTKDEPKIVNLKLEGIIKEDVVNEKTYLLTQTLIDQTWLTPVPRVSEHRYEKSVTADIKLDNPADYPFTVTGRLCDQRKFRVNPCEINRIIPPHSNSIQTITISGTGESPLDIATLPFIDISLNGEYLYNKTSYVIPASKKLLLSWKLPAAPLKNPAVTQLYHDRDTSGMIALNDPEYLGGKWYWSGPGDASVRFKLMKDEKYVYILILVNDDQWVRDKSLQKDLLYLHLEDSNGNPDFLTFSPDDNKVNIEGKGAIGTKDVRTTKFFSDSILMVEFRVPVTAMIRTDNSVRVNVGYHDQDDFPEKNASTLYWKPVWGTAEDYNNSGTFLLK